MVPLLPIDRAKESEFMRETRALTVRGVFWRKRCGTFIIRCGCRPISLASKQGALNAHSYAVVGITGVM